MRSVVAAFLFVPALLSAQAVHSGVSNMVASMDAPAFLFQTSAVHAAAPALNPVLIAPVRLTALQIAPHLVAADTIVDVEFVVDAKGVPQDVHVSKTVSRHIDDSVVNAVRQVRYTPGTLHGQAVDVPVTLHVELSSTK